MRIRHHFFPGELILVKDIPFKVYYVDQETALLASVDPDSVVIDKFANTVTYKVANPAPKHQARAIVPSSNCA